MDLQDLRYFCAVVSEGSLSKAAQKLHYAQSNLSTRIMQLEQEIGYSLFYRTNHGVTLTPKGDLLLKYATNLLNLVDETMTALKDDSAIQSTLKIGSMESTAVAYLPEFLAQFRDQNPQTSVLVDTGTTDLLFQKVLDHQLDGAFIAGPVKRPELAVKQVRLEKLCLIGSESLSFGENIQNLAVCSLLVFPYGCSYRRILEQWMKEEGLIADKIYEFNTLNAIFASVTAGLGIAVFPESCIKQYSRHDTLRILELPEKYALVSTVFVYRKDSYISNALRNFIDFI